MEEVYDRQKSQEELQRSDAFLNVFSKVVSGKAGYRAVIEMKPITTKCPQCGTVLDENMVDTSPEWREFSEDGEDRRRAGAPSTFPSSWCSTPTPASRTRCYSAPTTPPSPPSGGLPTSRPRPSAMRCGPRSCWRTPSECSTWTFERHWRLEARGSLAG